MNKLATTFLFMAALFISACSNDDEPQIPANAITVNLVNNDQQKTIGGSDVYINNANNFTTNECGIVDFGSKGGFSQNPNLTQIAQEVAVTPGNYYQIVLASDVENIAGQRAYPINTNFYNVFVDSWIYNADNEISGAKIMYAECYPDKKELPEWDSAINVDLKPVTHEEYVESVAYSFANGVKIDSNYDVSDFEGSELSRYMDIDIQDNTITFSSRSAFGASGKTEIIAFVRHESVFSRVRFIVKSAQ